jgi:hypothetical protein
MPTPPVPERFRDDDELGDLVSQELPSESASREAVAGRKGTPGASGRAMGRENGPTGPEQGAAGGGLSGAIPPAAGASSAGASSAGSPPEEESDPERLPRMRGLAGAKPEYNERRAKGLKWAGLASLALSGIGALADAPMATALMSGATRGFSGAKQQMDQGYQKRLGAYYDRLLKQKKYNREQETKEVQERQDDADALTKHLREMARDKKKEQRKRETNEQEAEEELELFKEKQRLELLQEKKKRNLPMTEKEKAEIEEIKSRIRENEAQAASASALAEERRGEEEDETTALTPEEIKAQIERLEKEIDSGKKTVPSNALGTEGTIEVPLSTEDYNDKTEALDKYRKMLDEATSAEGGGGGSSPAQEYRQLLGKQREGTITPQEKQRLKGLGRTLHKRGAIDDEAHAMIQGL